MKNDIINDLVIVCNFKLLSKRPYRKYKCHPICPFEQAIRLLFFLTHYLLL